MLHIDRSTVYRMAEDGRLPAIKVGRQWRFPADRIGALLHPDGLAGETDETPAADAADAYSADVVVLPSPSGSSGQSQRPGEPQPSGHPVPPGRSESSVWPGPMGHLASSGHPLPSGHHPESSGHPVPSEPSPVDDAFVRAAEAVLAVAGDLLGVMMVVTDMNGRPLTPVANPCDWFADRAEDPEVVSACSAEWQSMADDPDFAPRFRTGVLGFQCARAFIRSGRSLIGMVLAGGIAPETSTTVGLYHLQDAERSQVLAALPKVAAALSRVPARRPAAP